MARIAVFPCVLSLCVHLPRDEAHLNRALYAPTQRSRSLAFTAPRRPSKPVLKRQTPPPPPPPPSVSARLLVSVHQSASIPDMHGHCLVSLPASLSFSPLIPHNLEACRPTPAPRDDQPPRTTRATTHRFQSLDRGSLLIKVLMSGHWHKNLLLPWFIIPR